MRPLCAFAPVALLVLVLMCGPSIAHAADPAAPPAPDASGAPTEDWQARLELARLLSEAGRHEEAIAQYRKVVAEKPGDAAARVGLAQALFWTGKSGEAARVLEALDHEGLDEPARALVIDIAIANKNYPVAEKQLRAGLAARPDGLRMRLQLAEILSWTGRYPESIEQYEQLLAATPSDIQVRRKYAQVLSWAGRKQDAIRELQKTLSD